MKKVISQKFEAIMRILLAVTVIFTSFGYTTSVFAASIQKGDVRNEVNTVGSTSSAGDVELKKTVEKTDEEGIYKVTLTAKGKNKVTTESQYADIYTVVVLDTSGSMEKEVCVNRPFIFCKEWADIKYPEAVKGTKVFANTLLSKYPNAQLALLTFSSNVKKARDFDNIGFDNVDYPTPNGQTNLGAAIQKADEMLAEKKKSDANAKLYMVILSDGYPEGQTVNHTTAANHAKNVTGVEIFTIGYDTDENTQKLLQGVATDANHYSNADGNNVAQKFTDIAGSIETSVPAGRNATITDTIADGFSYVEGSGNNATVDGKKISFNLDEITEEGETVSFKIKIDKDLPTDWYPTNDKADITYTDVSDESVTKTITSSAEVYWVQETYEYRVNYYKDSINGTLLGTINGEEPKNTKINSTDIDINKYKPIGYGNGIIETDMPYTITGENDVINVVYKKRNDLSYTVEYYKDQNKISNDNDNTVNNQTFGNKVHEAEIDKNKYKPLLGYKDGIIETNMPYEIKEEDNVIRVCYFKRDDMSYTVKYLDKNTNNELYDSEIRENKTFEEVYTETAKESPYGYRLVGNDTQEVKIDAEDKVVIFYYEKRNDFSYTVMYLEEDTNNELATPEVRRNRTYLETYSEKAKPIDGYVVDEETKEIVLEENESRIIFYYNKKDDLSYKVIYYKDSLNTDAIGEETFENQTFEDIINSDDIDKDLYKPRKGYNSGVIATDMPYTIIDGENVINVIYTKKDNLTYRVEYYYDGNIDSSKTEYFENLTYGDVITNYKEKLPADYKFVNDTAPLTIDDTEDNVIKVYYESVSNGDVTPPKTGINNAGYLSITCIIGMIALSLSKKKQEN
ncbi:MAG: VWA domain-containing protein [Clostridium sp.]|nr:VWA domain-containing protein [Clostridium sp.]